MCFRFHLMAITRNAISRLDMAARPKKKLNRPTLRTLEAPRASYPSISQNVPNVYHEVFACFCSLLLTRWQRLLQLEKQNAELKYNCFIIFKLYLLCLGHV